MYNKIFGYILTTLLILALGGITFSGCGVSSANQLVKFSQLISEADKYNGQTVTLEAFYFGGFEISALAESLGPSTSGVWRIVPQGTLIWVQSGIPQAVSDKLYTQSDTPSGYAERMGKLKATGKFETGGKYGHLDAYQHRIAITQAELLEWTPPPAATDTSIGDLQVKVVDRNGQPLSGAKVISEEQPEGQLKVTGGTNESGIVIYKGIKAGNYRFYISRFNYTQTDLTITVVGRQTVSTEVRMVDQELSSKLDKLGHSFKGWELYSWQENERWLFTLIPGTNRNKTIEEIISAGPAETTADWVVIQAVDADLIKEALSRLPAGEFVTWFDGRSLGAPGTEYGRLGLPPEPLVNSIQAVAQQGSLDFHIASAQTE